ncbi:hypothetical protein CDD81_5878 [Ophiocordyceps australis]|uniref:Phosphoinositide phospholipase C n=1 Tax=Ophiocordyceps australis TaxID=1399860 RepID=A0A2C5YGB5_9HYPO|nr:hypothetical protein CDD81_5878 [Ophiocordyceps australis]
MSELPSRIAALNPFGSYDPEDDKGDTFVPESDADEAPTLHVSPALRAFLVRRGVISSSKSLSRSPEDYSDEQNKALQAMLDESRTAFTVPDSLTDPSKPLPEYFVSSSHNTYLLAHQLYGASSAAAYETTLRAGSRCVEIDAWDNAENPDEPKVTHGYTLVSHVTFRAVCETIRDVFDAEAAAIAKGTQTNKRSAVDRGNKVATPIMLSLENHCGDHGQRRLAAIMREVFGDRLLSEPVRIEGHGEQLGSGEHVSLSELGTRITVMVEYHIPGEIDNDDATDDEGSKDHGDDDEGEDVSEQEKEEARQARKAYRENKKENAAKSSVIVPELAELGVYAQSVKPGDNSWFDPGTLVNGPHHHLINLSETGLGRHLPLAAPLIATHNSRHLMRVYPRGTRIASSNLQPIRFWAVGAQVCALNWQTFGLSSQLNRALFHGSRGYVLKPEVLRLSGNGIVTNGKRKRLRLHVAGASSVPVDTPGREADSLRPYVTCNLYTPGGVEGASPPPYKRKTAPYKHRKFGIIHRGEVGNPPVTDPIWDETLEWVFEDNELVFVRILIKSDDPWARNPKLAVTAMRLLYAKPGWIFVRMMDMKGRQSACSLLVNFELEDVED